MEHIHTQITSATLVLLLCVALLWINISKGQGLTKIFSWLSPALFSLRTLFLKNEYYFYSFPCKIPNFKKWRKYCFLYAFGFKNSKVISNTSKIFHLRYKTKAFIKF